MNNEELREKVEYWHERYRLAQERAEAAEAKLAEMTAARDNLRRLADVCTARLDRVSKALEGYDAE